MQTQYFYTKEINSDQLCREIRTLLAQINVEFDTQLELISVDTVGDEVTITISDALPGETKTQLDELMANHVPENTPATLPEYAGNTEAMSGGLTIGSFYRTGEFVKVVY